MHYSTPSLKFVMVGVAAPNSRYEIMDAGSKWGTFVKASRCRWKLGWETVGFSRVFHFVVCFAPGYIEL